MHLNFSQQMKMSQQMKLAPRMIQSMEILQLPILALQERIDQELEENVVLEVEQEQENEDRATSDLDDLDETSLVPEVDNRDIAREEMVVDSNNSEADFERLLEMSSDWPEDNIMESSRPSANRMEEDGERANDQMANILSRPQSLQDYLLDQFHYFDITPEVKEFGEYLIQNLDKNGRVQGTLPEIIQVYGRYIDHQTAETALKMIQQLDPPGVGARDLKECLLLQVHDRMPLKDVIVTILSSHLEDLAQNRLPLIERKTGYSIELIKMAIEEMKTLDPFPGRKFESETVQNVRPDVFVEQGKNGQWLVRLEDESTPQLRISQKYIALLQNNPDDKTKEYIKRKIESAKWLIESIEQRNNTLKKVAQAIIDYQSDFLNQGEEFIVPLKMQQIADVVGVHVTTISRAVDDKWIATPRGLFPLKRFFGGGTTDANGEEVAWDIIRLKLKEVIDAEDKDDPLSDDAIVEELAKRGYQLARRTVTKYRKAMRIPSSRQRKQF